ncbi:hypothetical protein O3P69_003762 [Scylla paramamosain]|uniref:Uncharacterized protein n=1 Tax=Scylla paramamosain TaxID=85552 RepID=A0AAW0UF60_SCYPA
MVELQERITEALHVITPDMLQRASLEWASPGHEGELGPGVTRLDLRDGPRWATAQAQPLDGSSFPHSKGMNTWDLAGQEGTATCLAPPCWTPSLARCSGGGVAISRTRRLPLRAPLEIRETALSD